MKYLPLCSSYSQVSQNTAIFAEIFVNKQLMIQRQMADLSEKKGGKKMIALQL